jgi:hypothetical protein
MDNSIGNFTIALNGLHVTPKQLVQIDVYAVWMKKKKNLRSKKTLLSIKNKCMCQNYKYYTCGTDLIL